MVENSRVMMRCGQYGRRSSTRRDRKEHCLNASSLCGLGEVEQDGGTFFFRKSAKVDSGVTRMPLSFDPTT